jgi:hypothetical protein
MPFDKIHPFEERAVAFLDVLGFSALIKDAELQPPRRDELFQIITILDGHVKFDNKSVSVEVPDEVKPNISSSLTA